MKNSIKICHLKLNNLKRIHSKMEEFVNKNPSILKKNERIQFSLRINLKIEYLKRKKNIK